MARLKGGWGKLQPYTFTPAATDGGLQQSSPATTEPSVTSNTDVQSIPNLEQDPEILGAAHILMTIYQDQRHTVAGRMNSRLDPGRSPAHARNGHVFHVKLPPPEHDKDEELEILDSPTKQLQERMTKRRTTRGRAVVTNKLPTRTRAARRPAHDRYQDSEYFEHPVLTAIHDSPAKKSGKGRRASYARAFSEDDTTEVDLSASSEGDEKDPASRREKNRDNFKNEILTKIRNFPARKSRRVEQVGQVGDAIDTDSDTTAMDSSTFSEDDNLDDNKYIDQSRTHHRKLPTLHHDSSSSTLIAKPSLNTRPTGYVTPLGPTTSPLSQSTGSSQSTTILAQDSLIKSLSVAASTPSRTTALDHANTSSVTSVQKFLSEARRTQGHRRTHSLESSGFFEKVRRVHEALREGGSEDGDEDDNIKVEEDPDEHVFGTEEDSEGGVDTMLEDFTPSAEAEEESSGREEGEISDDDNNDGTMVSPPRWHRWAPRRGFGRSMVLDY